MATPPADGAGNLRPRMPLDGQDRGFFGHPRALAYLLGAEGGWAFAYFGLQGTLTLYMTQTLLKPGHVEHVLGFSAYRAAVQSLYGPLTPLGLASATFGLATALIYALPIVGGLLADRWIGQRRAAIAGVLVLTLAHGLLIAEPTFLVALAMIAAGTGLLKTALVGQIGRLYAPGDDRRTRGFGLYLIAMNTGALLTPLVVGTLGERLGWSFGYSAAAIGMGIAALCYLAGVRGTPADTARTRRDGSRAAPRLRPGDARVISVLLLMVVLDGVWRGVYVQAFNVFPVWASGHVDRHLFGFVMPVTWFSTLDGILTIVGAALAVRIWTWQRKRGGDLTDIRRISVGFLLATAAFLSLTLGAVTGGYGAGPLAAPLIFFILIDFSIPWIDTVILTMVSRDTPAAVGSTMLGVYYLATAGGKLLTGWLGGLADRMSMPSFWLLHAAINGAILLFLVLAGFRLNQLLARRRGAEAAAADVASFV